MITRKPEGPYLIQSSHDYGKLRLRGRASVRDLAEQHRAPGGRVVPR